MKKASLLGSVQAGDSGDLALRGSMVAAVLYAPGDLRIERVPVSLRLESNQALIRVKAAGICGSDIDRVMKKGTYRYPMIPGHEFCGEIAELGPGVHDFAIGDRVAVAPILPCFVCEYCQQGFYGQCNNYNYLGSRTDGGFAQFVRAPSINLIRMPDTLGFEHGALIEPAAVALHGMNNIGIRLGDSVAVLGCGALGLLAIQLVKEMGAVTVIAVDITAYKLSLARKLGADICIDASQNDTVEEILAITKNKGVSVAIETAGQSLTQEQCLRIVKKVGRILYLGTAHEDVVYPPETFERLVRFELTVKGSWNSFSAPFPGVEWTAIMELIRRDNLQLAPLISHVFKLYEAPEVFRDLVNHKYVFNKVIFSID